MRRRSRVDQRAGVEEVARELGQPALAGPSGSACERISHPPVKQRAAGRASVPAITASRTSAWAKR